MFLRAHARTKDGKAHSYWSLVETVRTPDGPRQRTLCYLGELNSSAEARWLKTIQVFNQQGESRQLRLFPAVGDLLGIAEDKINDTRLYRCLDRILPHKTKLEQHLKQRYGELFAAEFDVLLYDLTSSYVEGVAAKNPMMKRGYSRDHRPDCKQLVIALIVNGEGFPLSYETFDGNCADVSSLEAVMRMVERKYGKARRVWVFDRGIVSEENLRRLRKHQGQYLVGTPRTQLKQFERELLAEGWQQVRSDVEVKMVPMPSGEETYLLCRSAARQEKEKAIRSRFSGSIEKALTGLEKLVGCGKLKDRNKIERRLGAIRARHSRVADLYHTEIVEAGGRLQVDWKIRADRQAWQQAREGAYLLRTNLPPTAPDQLWKSYIQLTEAEAAFRALKSELAIRPIFHQLEHRTKAHVLVAFLGYALWVTLKHLLNGKNPGCSPAQALAIAATLHSTDIVLPTTDGREIRLRRITTPTPEQRALFDRLNITVPDRLSFDQECSADSAIA
jgi:transposase